VTRLLGVCHCRVYKDSFYCQYNVVKNHCSAEAARVLVRYTQKVTARLLSHFNCSVGQFISYTTPHYSHASLHTSLCTRNVITKIILI